MLSRLQELRKEEETLLRVKAALHEQLTRLKVRAAQGGRRPGRGRAGGRCGLRGLTGALGQMDNEATINQTELHLSLQGREEEEEEEEEESDS
ncbi:SNPC5 protein, partial [Atlantisia rogersi]|nr:SNPC5 protein [Atlantisia rogersi]